MNVEELLTSYAAGVRDFIGVNLTEANLTGANLSKANFSKANLSVANLRGANLSESNLSRAKLNVTGLSGANLAKSNLSGAILNVANLIRADLSGAVLIQAALIRAELVLADLSGSDLRKANLNEANLKEAKLRQANLSGATLVNADLRGASLTAAILSQTNLQGADLSGADLRGVDLRDAELKQTKFTDADLQGADLSRANLRWADLSGAKLNGADLSSAKLSGADLNRADLSEANLLNTSLVYADLSQASLIGADWVGADLTGATLTGAKVYGVSRFGVKTEGITCEWIDLSPTGDRSDLYRFYASEECSTKFFKEKSPTIQIVVDCVLDQEANLSLALTYKQLAQMFPEIGLPPSIEVGRRRTTLTFNIDIDDRLLSNTYIIAFPFADAAAIQKNVVSLLRLVQVRGSDDLSAKELERLQQISATLGQIVGKANEVKLDAATSAFFQASTQITLTNSNDQPLSIYQSPTFGKRLGGIPNLSESTFRGTQPALHLWELSPTSFVASTTSIADIHVLYLRSQNSELDHLRIVD